MHHVIPHAIKWPSVALLLALLCGITSLWTLFMRTKLSVRCVICVSQEEEVKYMSTNVKIIIVNNNYRNFTNTNLITHLKKHTTEYSEFERLDKGTNSSLRTSANSARRTLEESIAICRPFDFNHPRSQKLHRAIGEMIAVDCMPFYTVERPGILRLMKEIEPRYTPCSRNYFSQSLIPSMFQKVKECIAKLVEKEQHISLTTDIWSSDSLDS